MKTSILAAIAAVTLQANGLSIPTVAQQVLQRVQHPLTSPELYLIELAPGQTRWVTEAEKWQIRREGKNFIDITETQDLANILTTKVKVTFPDEPAYNESVVPLLHKLSKDRMHKDLAKFSSYHTRYYKSDSGAASSRWLLGRVNETLADAGALKHGASVRAFEHPWGQHSVIATLPGKSNKTVVVGAHQDSINLFFPSLFAAPGADDDGSGTVTILESLRALLKSDEIVHGEQDNTIEFHWYAAEEGGLLGSQAIFQDYAKRGRDVRAMLQQDMTGYVKKTVDAGNPEAVGIITDFVDEGLTEFIKKIVVEYCAIPYVLTECGYACSDHASASKAGYPSSFSIESEFKYSDPKVHTTEDKIEYLSFDHMREHAKMTVAYAYELGFADL